jgi:hypothetical protein
VVLINLPHSLSTVRRYATVKEVRAHSGKGDAEVVGIVVALPCCGMEAIASVTSGVWAPYGGSLVDLVERDPAPDPGRGSGELELASDALRGRASRSLRPRP